MKRMIKLWGFLAAIVLLGSCRQIPENEGDTRVVPNASPDSSSLLVAAAASLQPALEEITPVYQQLYPQESIDYSFAASGILQQQIEQGAPFDVFISAAALPMDTLDQKGFLKPGTRQDLLTNTLVLIVPKSAAVALTDFQGLGQPTIERIAIGEPRTVPAGSYAQELLQNLGIWDSLAGKLVFAQNVKSVLTTIETGAADAGIVYITDANASDQVTIVALADPRLHAPIVYPIAVIQSSQNHDRALNYLQFLQSEPAQNIFQKRGFGIATPN